MRTSNRRSYLVSISLAVHIGIVLALFVVGFWHLDRLPAERSHVAITQVDPMPAPAGSPAAAPATPFHKKTAKRPAPALVQPVVAPPETAATPQVTVGEGAGNGSGEGSGSGEGNGSGSGSGECEDPPCKDAPPEIPPPQTETIIPPTVLAGMRIAGDAQIHPPELVRTQMVHAGQGRAIGVYEVCVAASGDVRSVRQRKSTGYAEYDRRLAAGIRTWRYRPYMLKDRPIPVCGMVTFIYSLD